MFSYVAYGLGIQSYLVLPELSLQEVAADVQVRLGAVDQNGLEVVDQDHCFRATGQEACHFFRGVGAFLARRGREVIVDPLPDADERVVRLSILGPAMALILHQRGRLILHASAVGIAGEAVAFLGGPGWGKSTTAAALYARGHDMLTDDVLAIDMESSGYPVIPSFPQFKLWPESATALGEQPETLPLLHPELSKRARRVTQRFADAPCPIASLYVLAEAPSLHMEPLQPQEALHVLMRHWYGARFGAGLLRTSDMAAHFRQCANLVHRVRVCRLARPSCLAALPELARFVEADLRHSGALPQAPHA